MTLYLQNNKTHTSQVITIVNELARDCWQPICFHPSQGRGYFSLVFHFSVKEISVFTEVYFTHDDYHSYLMLLYLLNIGAI